MEEKKLVIDWNEKFNLIIEQNPDPNYHMEVFCYLQEKSTGIIWQDVAIIRQSFFYDKNDDFKVVFNPNEVQVLVYADTYSEDYTNEFEFDIYEEEEE